MEAKTEGWITGVGIGVVLSIMATITLVAAGGWGWFADFLTSTAANWIQAISSAIAIFLALWLATSEDRRRHTDERLQSELAALRTALFLGNLISWCEGLLTSAHTQRESTTGEAFGAIVRQYDALQRPPIEAIAPALLRIGVGARLIGAWSVIDQAVIVMRGVAEEVFIKYDDPENTVRRLIGPLPVALRASRWELIRFLESVGYTVNIENSPIEKAVQDALSKLAPKH